MTVEIRVTVTDAEYRALLTIAAKHDVQIHKLIEAQVRRGLKPKSHRNLRDQEALAKRREELEVRDRRIKELNGQLWSDNRIAKHLGIAPGTVGNARRRLKLPKHFAKFGEVAS